MWTLLCRETELLAAQKSHSENTTLTNAIMFDGGMRPKLSKRLM